MLRRVPRSVAEAMERRRPDEACGGAIGFSPWGSTQVKIFSCTDSALRPKPFSLHIVQVFGDLHNGLLPNFSSDHNDQVPTPSPRLLEPIPESFPSGLEYIRVEEETNEVLEADSIPPEVEKYKYGSDELSGLPMPLLQGQSQSLPTHGVVSTLPPQR
jgi:hypothetical protein